MTIGYPQHRLDACRRGRHLDDWCSHSLSAQTRRPCSFVRTPSLFIRAIDFNTRCIRQNEAYRPWTHGLRRQYWSAYHVSNSLKCLCCTNPAVDSIFSLATLLSVSRTPLYALPPLMEGPPSLTSSTTASCSLVSS